MRKEKKVNIKETPMVLMMWFILISETVQNVPGTAPFLYGNWEYFFIYLSHFSNFVHKILVENIKKDLNSFILP